jgi:hypothetical protein
MVPLRESGGAERPGALFCGSHMLQGWLHTRNIVLPTRGTGHFARRLRPAAVVSVPPCRADVLNLRTSPPPNTSPLVTGVPNA